MEKNNTIKGNKPLGKKYTTSAIVLLLMVIIAFIFIFIEQNKPDPASEAIIKAAVARQLGKDPNELTEEDFAKITELCIAKKEMVSFGGQPQEVYTQIEISDIKQLKKFVNLEELDLSFLKFSQRDIPKWILYLDKIGLINVSNNSFIDLSPIRNHLKIKKLKMTDASINNIKPLANLKELELLDLTTAQISDIKMLASFPKLESLTLDATGITDLKPLHGLTDLRELYLSFTQVTDIEPLKGLTNLQKLVLNSTNVSSLESLRELTNLQELYITDIPATNIETLKGLKKLKTLFMQNNKNISDEQVEDLQNALPNLTIYHSPFM